MRLLVSCILICLLSLKASCQDSESKAFLHAFFGDSAKIVYLDKLWEEQLENMQNALSQDTLYTLGAAMNNPMGRLVLTQAEHNYILHELTLQANATWPSHLFIQGKLLTTATLDSIYKDPTRGRNYFKAHYGSRLYSFSKPIFIRDHSLCIFFSGYSCGNLCGEGKLMIFRKESAVWVPWLELYRWAS